MGAEGLKFAEFIPTEVDYEDPVADKLINVLAKRPKADTYNPFVGSNDNITVNDGSSSAITASEWLQALSDKTKESTPDSYKTTSMNSDQYDEYLQEVSSNLKN